ncbi:Mitochondrial amidoxime reducing component 2 [Quaeritorhiza haematococci]|nr:Mitochondrial amidoxime reducing component 2 [Quaeritorhiza haematococci]
MLEVSALYIYPIKSCRGIKVPTWPVNKFGLELDRYWVVATSEGKFITQRQYPRMVLISARLEFLSVADDNSNSTIKKVVIGGPNDEEGERGLIEKLGRDLYDREDGFLVLSAPGMEREVRVPFKRSESSKAITKITVWNRSIEGFDEGDEVAEWLSEFLGTSARLFVKNPNSRRELSARHTPPRDLMSYDPQTAFADGYPMLLCTETSITDITKRVNPTNYTPYIIASTSLATLLLSIALTLWWPQNLSRQIYTVLVGLLTSIAVIPWAFLARTPSTQPINVSARNFRPNIVLRGSRTAFEEDTWLIITINNKRFYVANRSTRCQMPCNDPDTGIMGKEPLKTLMKYRRVDPGAKYEACFGVNLIHAEVGFLLGKGDGVDVVEKTMAHDRKRGLWNPEN